MKSKSTIGLTSQGYLIQIEEFEYVPPIIPPTTPHQPSSPSGGGGSSAKFHDKKDQKKIVMITVEAHGKKFKSKHIVNKSIRVSISDIEIKEDNNGIVEIILLNKPRRS